MAKDLVANSESHVKFHLFGHVRAIVDGRQEDLGPEKVRRLLVALLLAKGRSIARVDLMDWLWEGDTAPGNPPHLLEKYMSLLRTKLDGVGLRDVLISRDGQCRLEVPPDWVDVHRFRALVARARTASDQEAVELLRVALELSEGEPFTGLGGRLIDNSRWSLVEERRVAEVDFYRIELQFRRHRQHLGDLTRLHRERPEDIETTGLTMIALALSGRKPDAMAAYERHRAALTEQGDEVSQPIRDLQTRILNEEDGTGIGPEDFPPREPNRSAGGEASGDVADPAASAVAPQVINKVRRVRGENIVFGIQNQARS